MTRAAAVTLLAVPFAVVSASIAAGPTPSAPGSVADPSAWGQWRGPLATGVGPKADPPIEWSVTKNVRWKVEVPGRGSGTPVVWGDRVFLLTAIPSGRTGAASHEPQGGKSPRDPHQFKLLAYDRKTGTLAWERTAREETPHEASHQDNGTWASSSAITDGEHVIAYFESRGIHVFDMNGTKVWD